MANLKSAIKRARVGNRKRVSNQSFRSKMRSQIKLVDNLVAADNLDDAKQAYQVASRTIDKTVQKGLIHKNSGDRQKSRLAKKLRKLSA